MFRLKKFPKVLTSFYIIGYIFALFALLSHTDIRFTIITFLSSALLNVLYVTSDEYRATKYMIRAKKQMDKGQCEKAADCVIKAASIQANEDILVQINAVVKKTPENYGKTAEFIEGKFGEYDTPYLRFIASSFYYAARKLEQARDALIQVPMDALSVKAARLLGSVLYELGDYSKALNVFLKYDPSHNPATDDELAVVYGIAICRIARKERKKAVESLSRIAAKHPKYGNSANIIAQLNEELKKGKTKTEGVTAPDDAEDVVVEAENGVQVNAE